ncbi:MAG: sigma-70 family RNA polymerase sigma factor [Verrucomicrobia bacterium]|nr:sigma-70 family RNA polymerase sigma factor [Verrucomicrobiota bacterium]
MPATEHSDAELVAQSLADDREAFGRIVSRYQSLICSLAYNATGSLSASEDLAQQTFLTAWQRLRQLREPAKLRAWLCGIARGLTSNAVRRQTHQPVHAAVPLDAIHDLPASAPTPDERAITREEEAILWRSLERIPDDYREPLILFYREGESIERVAAALELSEDAIRQRLSRGRKLLHQQVLALVEGTLRQTKPGKAFTLGVVAALPLLATTATAATAATATATKGGSAAKAAGAAGMWSVLLSSGMLILYALFGVFGYGGRWVGRKMGRASQQTTLGRRRLIQFWRTLAIGFAVLVLPAGMLPGSVTYSRPWLVHAQTWSLSAFYWLVAAALVIWVWQRRRDARHREAEATAGGPMPGRSYTVWLALGMAGPALILGIFVFSLLFTDRTLTSTRIEESEARNIMTSRPDAQWTVYQYKDGSKSLNVALPEDRRIHRWTILNDALLAALAEQEIAPATRVENRDFHNGGVRGWMVLLSTFIVVAGTVLLLRRPGTAQFHRQETATPRAERIEKNILAAGAAVVLIALAALLGLVTSWVRTLSAAEARSGLCCRGG